MKRIHVLFLACLGVLSLSVSGYGQPTATSTEMFDRPVNPIQNAMIDSIKTQNLHWQCGLSFLVLNPQDSLRRAVEHFGAPGTGYGFTVDLSYYMDPVPFALGMEMGVAFFGSTDRTFYQPVGPFIDTLKYESINTHVPLNLYVRFQPNLYNWVFPYVEAIGGLTIVGSSLDISRSNGAVQTSDSRSETSSTWQYGVGGGMMIKFLDIINLPSELQRVLLDMRIRYLWGSSVDVTAIKINDDQTYQVVNQSVPSTGNVHFSVGIVAQF